MKLKEPQIHGCLFDGLPDDHYLANTAIDCDECKQMLHCSMNECMQVWVETGKGNFCLRCFDQKINDESEDCEDFSLKD